MREIDHIVYDAKSVDVSISKQQQQIDWKATMERLAFSSNDLIPYTYNYEEDNDYFNLYVSIRTQFINKQNKRSQYFGVFGAILLQTETSLNEQRNNKDVIFFAETVNRTN
eukprot:TRINITY_DN6885_c0_g1_i1.p1 TRINITY_DN6885_c0_g1~~TRINITY_DN6885_c0_g1_i1.p1  ORF type:complete len:111 (-),score=19.10 TRINITY_DN6885_c0_g1_i1:36-368(-)